MISVEDLIAQLQECNPKAVVFLETEGNDAPATGEILCDFGVDDPMNTTRILICASFS